MVGQHVQTLEVFWSEQFAHHCVLIKRVSALCFALMLHTLPCVMLFSHSPKGCEKRKHGERCAALSHEISPAHSARVKHSLFSVGFTSFSVFVPCPCALCLAPCAAHGTIGIDHHSASNRKKRIPTPRVVLTVAWVQSYSAEPFARISALQTAYKKVIFLLSKNYKLIISML